MSDGVMLAETATLRLALIGGGFMGEAIIDGLLKASVVRPQEVRVSEAVAARRAYLSQTYAGIAVGADLEQAVAGCEIVLLAVKPQDFTALAPSLRPLLQPEQVAVSIMAGVRIAAIAEVLAHERVVRVMPNTPAALGAAFSTWMATDAVSAAQCTAVQRVLAALGPEARVGEEHYLDMATAVAGSGPAYVFLFLEALTAAAVQIGLPRPLATAMVQQTLLGSARMAIESGRHAAELRDMVTSPGGTTAAALHVLERAALRGAIADAVVAAYERSRALGS